MRNKFWIRMVALVLVLSLVGCGTPTSQQNNAKESANVTVNQEDVDKSTTVQSEETTDDDINVDTETNEETTTEKETETEISEEEHLNEKQKNSFSMLYYLAITAEDIRISKDNKLMLEDIYNALLNDINPDAIDETTQEHLQNLRTIIGSYIDISTKRERLQYIYNQNKASAMRSAVPDPLAVLSMTGSLDWKRLAAGAVFTIVDSYNNYKSAEESAEQEFIIDGWELDDAETETIRRNRDKAFDYMVDIVQEYDLDGLLTLSEDSIKDFAEICDIESLYLKIERLESEYESYQLLGNYWLELADCYYETEQYEKCLECIKQYNELATGIYRKDSNYVQILPKAIVAAQNVYQGEEYVTVIADFVDSIIKNTKTDEWSVRYFAAQAYLDLYSKTSDVSYKEKSYEIVKDNVSVLLEEQEKLNSIYLADLEKVEVEEPDYRFLTEKEEKERKKEYKEEVSKAKEYNKEMEENRKTELSPLYEPLIVNCDLLFALAEDLDVSAAEKTNIEKILETEENGIFISKAINDRYSFSTNNNEYEMVFDGKTMEIPAYLLSDGAEFIVTINNNGKKTVVEDCKIKEVERIEKAFESFVTHITSKTLSKYDWTADAKIIVEIYNGKEYDPIKFDFKVSNYKDRWLIPDKVVFEQQ